VARAYAGVVWGGSYFPLWLRQLVPSLGSTLHDVAPVVLVLQRTVQGLAMAGPVAAEVVPVLLLGSVAGVVIDRFGRKAVLVGADLVQAVVPTPTTEGERLAATSVPWSTGRLVQIPGSSIAGGLIGLAGTPRVPRPDPHEALADPGCTVAGLPLAPPPQVPTPWHCGNSRGAAGSHVGFVGCRSCRG